MEKRTPTHFISDFSSSSSRAYLERSFIPLVVEESGEEDQQRRSMATRTQNMRLSLPLLPVLILALFHFTLSCLTLLAAVPFGYAFVHLLMILMAIWSSQDKTSIIAVAVYIYLIAFSLLVDLITLGVYWESLSSNGIGRFAITTLFFNFFTKFPSIIYTVFILYQKSDGFNFPFLKRNSNNGYSEISGTVHVDVESNEGNHEAPSNTE